MSIEESFVFDQCIESVFSLFLELVALYCTADQARLDLQWSGWPVI
jgi:hypothetical protein